MSQITNAQWLQQLATNVAALQAGTMTQAAFIAAMQSPTDGWIGISASDQVLAQLVQSTVAGFVQRDANFDAWVNGTPTGGYTDTTGATKGGPFYPLTNLAGGVTYLKSPQGIAKTSQFYACVYDTQAHLFADLAHDATSFALVYGDPTPANNGTYVKSGVSGSGSWVQNGSVSGLSFQPLAPDTGYVAAFVDAAGRASWLVRTDGTFEARKIALPAASVQNATIAAGAVDLTKLDATTQAGFAKLPQPLNMTETGYAWAVVDAAGHIAMGVKTDGSVYVPKFSANTPAPIADGTITTSKIAAGAIDVTKLASALSTLMPQAMIASETGYAYAIVGASGRMAFGIKLDGSVVIPKFTLPDGSITSAKLAPALLTLMPAALAAETGYVWALVDASGRIGLGVRPDGTVVGKFANSLVDGAVTETKLASAVRRQAMPHTTDVISVRPDPWRATFGDVAVRTGADGSFWTPFHHSLTTQLRGLNRSGVSLDFRKSVALPFRGKRYCGTFDPGSNPSTRKRADFQSTSTYPPAPSSPLAGDYESYVTTTPALMGGTDTYDLGDLAVYNGTSWSRQAGPAPSGGGAGSSREPGDWWILAAGGTYDGVVYAAGDRLVYVGFQSNSGTGWARWTKGDITKGEVFYRGEFTPASGLPSSPADGEVYQASAAGTGGGFTFAIGDYLIHEAGIWGQIVNAAPQTIAAGAFACLPCVQGASEWEVRRTDKSSTRVGAILKNRKQASPRRNSDLVYLLSDSLYGVSGVGASVLTKTGRAGVVKSFGGGTSSQVAAMWEYEIAVLGDAYAGAVLVPWHGQNNQPSTADDANSAQIKSASLMIRDLAGARDMRLLYLSVLGQRNPSWNGTRIVCSQHENMFAKTGPLYDIEQWYSTTFPGQWLSPRLALLAAAGSLPDPQFPGMTEAQVASTYGIVPYSFFRFTDTLPVAQTSLHYVGTWSSAALPSGGSPNDYYLRVGGGTVGNLLINAAGAWTEFAPDATHLSPAGADALSTAIANTILNNYW